MRIIVQAEDEKKKKKKKEKKRGEKRERRERKKKKGVLTFPSILSSNVARSFSLGIVERASNAPIPIFAIGIDIELRNGALVNFRKVYRACLSFLRAEISFFPSIIHVTIIIYGYSLLVFDSNLNPRGRIDYPFEGGRND